jgi:hypothetical protein
MAMRTNELNMMKINESFCHKTYINCLNAIFYFAFSLMHYAHAQEANNSDDIHLGAQIIFSMPGQSNKERPGKRLGNGVGFAIYMEKKWKNNNALRLRWKRVTLNRYKFTDSFGFDNTFENDEKGIIQETILEHSYYPTIKYLPYSIVGLGYGEIRWDQRIKSRWESKSITGGLYYGIGWNLPKQSALEFRYKIRGPESFFETSLSLLF